MSTEKPTHKGYLKLNDISAYKTSFHLSDYVWKLVILWEHFAKDTVGKQFVRAVDLISSNIAEGFGRYTKKDKIKFYRYSYGSIKESLDCNEKAKIWKLISIKDHTYILQMLNALPADIHSPINFTNAKITK